MFLVRVKRLELVWVAPLEPKSSASTSFAIPAKLLDSSDAKIIRWNQIFVSIRRWRHCVVAIPVYLNTLGNYVDNRRRVLILILRHNRPAQLRITKPSKAEIKLSS